MRLMKFGNWTAILVLLFITLTVNGKDLFVDQSSSASDKNPGTKDKPFKTLSHAGKVARPGDHVYVRRGVYRETLNIESPNNYPQEEPKVFWKVTGRYNQRAMGKVPDRIVFEAYENESVTIDGSEILDKKAFKAVDGKNGVYVIPLKEALKKVFKKEKINTNKLNPRYIFWNDQRIHPYRKRNKLGIFKPAIPEAAGAPAFHYDTKKHLLYLHLGGADPRSEGKVEVAIRLYGISATATRNVTLSKLKVRRLTNAGITATKSERIIVEDCDVQYPGFFGIQTKYSDNATIRRNFVHDADGRGICVHGAYGAEVYGNVVSNYGLARRGYLNYAFTVFGGEYCSFYHNIAIQPREVGFGNGYWTDCPGVGHIWMGNAAVRAGFYIESPAIHNLIQWNTVWRFRHQGIYLRANISNLVRQNLVAYCKMVGLHIGSTDNNRHEVAGNVFIQNWLKQNNSGISVGSERGHPGEQNVNFAQANVYETAPGKVTASWGGRRYDTLEEFQEATGQESLGREEKINYKEIGLVWVRANVKSESFEPFPMIANPSLDRQGTQIRCEPYFWRRGDAEGSDHFPGEWTGGVRAKKFPQFADEMSRGAKKQQRGISRLLVIPPIEGTPVKDYVLHLIALSNPSLGKRGIGMWSQSLPTVPGAHINIALWMKSMNIKATSEGGGAVVYVEWSDWTGQNKSRSYIVGGENNAEFLNPKSGRGTADWHRVAGRVTAPQEARRFKLYLGFRNASGEVMYDAIEEIRTEAGTPPVVVDKKPKKENKPLIDPKKSRFEFVDLSGVTNRPLGDELADDGKGGWTDQGASADMRDLKTGLQKQEGIPFQLLAPKTCVVLKSKRRKQSQNLPNEVIIPVNKTADVLYFLHSGAWIGDERKIWTYEIVYKDGKTESIPIIGGVNVRDWSIAGEPYDFPNNANRRTTVWHQIVGNIVSPTCGIFMMESRNLHSKVPIKEIRMKTGTPELGDAGVPILLGITLGTKK